MTSARPTSRPTFREFSLDWIIHQDDSILVINKPAGLPSQPSVDRKRANLYDLLLAWRKSTPNVKDPYIGLHHRLDRDTSGVIFVTLKRTANKAMAEQVSGHTLHKVYWAKCADARKSKKPLLLQHEWKIDNHLAKTGGKQKQISKMKVVNSGGDHALTDFKIMNVQRLEQGRLLFQYLIEARPKTGRMHQIRIHLSESGLPIFGDHVYAPEDVLALAPRTLLHARSLGLVHPATGENLTFEAPVPEDFNL